MKTAFVAAVSSPPVLFSIAISNGTSPLQQISGPFTQTFHASNGRINPALHAQIDSLIRYLPLLDSAPIRAANFHYMFHIIKTIDVKFI